MGLSKSERKFAAKVCDDEQRTRFEHAGLGEKWHRMSEVEAAFILGDTDYLQQQWIRKTVEGIPIIERGQLVVDHIDNNDENNPADGSNWQWLTRSENLRKNPVRDRTLKYKSSLYNDSEHFVERERERERGSKNINGNPLVRAKRRGNGSAWTYLFADDELIVRDWIMAKSLQIDEDFPRIVKRIMRRLGECDWNEVLESACQESHCSLQAGDKRLKMLSAKHAGSAPFERETIGGKKILRWKPKKNDKSPSSLPGEIV